MGHYSMRAGLILGAALLAATSAQAGTITEGFEGGSYNLATVGGGSAAVSTTPPVLSGAQALDLSLLTGSDYARVKLDVTSSGLTLGQITSADYWVNRGSSSSNQSPYIIFSIDTPGGTNDDTLAVMWNPHDIGIDPASGTWTDITVDPLTTLFHVEGDQTGLINPATETLAALSASFYAPGLSWGSFAVDFVRIGLGQAGNDGTAYIYNVDDLTIHAADVALPEPVTLSMFGVGLVGAAALRRRRRRSAA